MARVIHFELPINDPERAINFYSKVFGWKIQKWEGPMEYWLVTTGDSDEPGIDGGLYLSEDAGEGSSWVAKNLTLGVDSVDDAATLLEKHGGKVVRPKGAIPGVGWVVYCDDTEGNTFGLMQEDPQAG